jgi:mannose-6-phosphate isomerase-like protein (cupin superfamily)
MIRTLAALSFAAKQDIRGGAGPARGADYLERGEMDGVLAAGRTILAAGSSVGEHAHPATEELYLILEGRGQGVLDGSRFPVGPGDLFLCKAGHSHGLINDSDAPLTYFGLMTSKG